VASEDTVEILRRTPVLRFFELDAMRVIANVADIRRLRAYDVLFREGDRSDGAYVVLSGRVAVERGAGIAPVDAGPGALIGSTALFIRTLRPATAVATDTATVLRVSPTLMKRVLNEYPAAAGPMRDAVAAEFAGTAREQIEALQAFERHLAGPA
jgi:CRP-like cAMP-binding protein